MTTKTIEVRDRATFIPMLAIRLDPDCEADSYLLARAGYGIDGFEQGKYVLLAKIDGGSGTINCNPWDWSSARTIREAHKWIIEHWEEFPSGAVVDVEFILGETTEPKVSEASEVWI